MSEHLGRSNHPALFIFRLCVCVVCVWGALDTPCVGLGSPGGPLQSGLHAPFGGPLPWEGHVPHPETGRNDLQGEDRCVLPVGSGRSSPESILASVLATWGETPGMPIGEGLTGRRCRQGVWWWTPRDGCPVWPVTHAGWAAGCVSRRFLCPRSLGL